MPSELPPFRSEYVAGTPASSRREAERKPLVDCDSTYDAILSIPIASLVCEVMGWESDGRNFYEPGRRKRKGCFVPDGENFLAHGGTDHLPSGKRGYSPFDFVKAALNLDNAATFAWFKENFPELKGADNG